MKTHLLFSFALTSPYFRESVKDTLRQTLKEARGIVGVKPMYYDSPTQVYVIVQNVTGTFADVFALLENDCTFPPTTVHVCVGSAALVEKIYTITK